MADNTLKMQLHTMLLRVKNLERSREWYEQKLGMTIFHEDRHYRVITLQGDSDNRITLWELSEGERLSETFNETAYAVFNTPDTNADHRILAARGVEVTEPDDTVLGVRFFWITDPDGYRHCVLEFLPE